MVTGYNNEAYKRWFRETIGDVTWHCLLENEYHSAVSMFLANEYPAKPKTEFHINVGIIKALQPIMLDKLTKDCLGNDVQQSQLKTSIQETQIRAHVVVLLADIVASRHKVSLVKLYKQLVNLLRSLNYLSRASPNTVDLCYSLLEIWELFAERERRVTKVSILKLSAIKSAYPSLQEGCDGLINYLNETEEGIPEVVIKTKYLKYFVDFVKTIQLPVPPCYQKAEAFHKHHRLGNNEPDTESEPDTKSKPDRKRRQPRRSVRDRREEEEILERKLEAEQNSLIDADKSYDNISDVSTISPQSMTSVPTRHTLNINDRGESLPKRHRIILLDCESDTESEPDLSSPYTASPATIRRRRLLNMNHGYFDETPMPTPSANTQRAHSFPKILKKKR